MRKNYFVYLFLILLFIVIILTLLIKFSLITSVIIITLSGWFSFAFKILYSKWEWFYLSFNRIIYIFANPDTTWNMTIKYTFKTEKEIKHKLIENLLLSDKLKEAKLINLESGDFEIRSGRLIFQFVLHNNELEVHVLDLPVTYNKSIEIIETTLNPFFEEIEQIILPDKKIYFLKVTFDGSNPYFGLYLNKIPKNSLIHFDVSFIIDTGKVEITKDSVTLLSESKSLLANLTRNYLALTPKRI